MSQRAMARQHHRLHLAVIALVVVAAIVIVGFVAIIWYVQREQGDGAATLEASAANAETLPQTVPFRFIVGHIVVDALLGDKTTPTPMILDTGAPTILSDEVAKAVAGEASGGMSTVAIDGTIEWSDVVAVSTLRLGGAEFTNVGAIKGFLGPDNPLACISDKGLIGASLMKEGVWQIDYRTQELTVAADTNGLDHIEGAFGLSFSSPTSSSPSPRIQVPAAEGTLEFLVDTGSDAWLAVNPADLEEIGIKLDASDPAYSVIGAGAAGTYEDRVRYVATDLDFGGQQLAGVPVATLEILAAGEGNIGNDFLSRYVVTFDWPHAMLYLDPVVDDPQPSVPASATISWDGDNVIVGSLVDGTPGYDGTVELGAAVAAVDGRDVSSATFDEYCGLSTAGLPDAFEMTLVTDPGNSVRVRPVTDFYEALASS